MNGYKSYKLSWGSHSLSLGNSTCIMGILNVTPDSFSDGGLFFSCDAAVAQGEKKIDEQVTILIKNSYKRAKDILNENIDILHKLAELLLEKETVKGDELDDLIRSMRPDIELSSDKTEN